MGKILMITGCVIISTFICCKIQKKYGSVNATALEQENNVFDFGKGTNKYNIYMYRKDELDRDIINFNENFKYDPSSVGSPLANPIVTIQVGQIVNMFGILKKYDPKTCFGALKIYYGIENQKMVFICEPITLVINENYSKNICDTLGSGQFYIPNDKGILGGSIGNEKKDDLVKNYMDSVWIQHQDSDDHHFIPGDDYINDDTRFAVITLQQILKMYQDNVLTQTTSDVISFQIAASNLFTYSSNKKVSKSTSSSIKNYKVHVIAYIKDKIQNSGYSHLESNFQNLGADFSEMCPPNTATVQVAPY